MYVLRVCDNENQDAKNLKWYENQGGRYVEKV